ncbi:MAG: bacteriohemerythrin [Ancalomicrobiaceae bacterium]|nr:bacteriohemerythrin [Ancalomicrobiaceae bacterium]
MKFFYWNANLEIGIPAIDAQHRRLVDLINELAAVITDGGQLPKVSAVIGDLLDYAAVHFADEERIMAAAPMAEDCKQAHRRSHQCFIARVQEIARSSELHQSELAEKILDFLTTWLISHILGSDREIARSLRGAHEEAYPAPSLLDVSPVARVLINALSETERRFRLVSDCAPALIWVSDASGRRSYYNRTWYDLVGACESCSETFDLLEFVHPDDRPGYASTIARLCRDQTDGETEYRIMRPDGHEAWLIERIRPRADTNGAFMGLIASASDITVIKQSEALLSQSNRLLEAEVARRTAQLEALTQTDPLIGIGNRRMLDQRLDDEVRRAQRHRRPLTAIYFDVDHFKAVNDTFGHGVGDQLLIRVGRTLKANLEDGDILVRYGGEEFVAILVETGLDQAWRTAERLRTAVGRIRLRVLGDNAITISAGVAEWQVGEAGDSLLQRADRALFIAKNAGRNCCRVDLAA